MKKRTYNLISFFVFILVILILSVIAFELIKSYRHPELFKEYIEGFGIWGFFIMLFIQITQVVVAFIPGEAIEFVAGTIYGWFGGLIICLVGIAIGQLVIFKAVGFFGKRLVERAAGSKIMNKYKFLHDEKRLKAVIFFLFFIPGTPKDLITYIVPLTKIKLRDFIIINLFARLPSVISSTCAGNAFADKAILKLFVIYGIVIIFSAIGLLIYRYWDKKHTAKQNIHKTKKYES
ncbi:MAG: TVP38/TMEM64 family protein [Ruminococcaceae bacterium]|nr:TVP38/TMEM64 family protein [Oscillospiraceae bacterium]